MDQWDARMGGRWRHRESGMGRTEVRCVNHSLILGSSFLIEFRALMCDDSDGPTLEWFTMLASWS